MQPTPITPNAPPEPSVKLTQKAVEFAKKQREKLGLYGASLRVGVKGGGCSGLTYVTEFTADPPKSRDLVYDYGDLRVYVDSRSLKYVEGSVIDFENTLMWQGFKWHNPLQATACGCGLTFSPKEKPDAEPVAPTKEGQALLENQGKKIFKTV